MEVDGEEEDEEDEEEEEEKEEEEDVEMREGSDAESDAPKPRKKKGKKIDKLRTAVRFARKVRQRPLRLGQTFALLRAHATRYLLPLSQSC